MSIRYGIIGTGMMGCEHIRNILRIQGADITAIADINEKSLNWGINACGDKFSPKIFNNYQELLMQDDIDAVVVATPNFSHIDVMREVFKTNKHVLLEKPMCTSLKDAKEVMESSKTHKGVVWIGLEYRYMTTISAALKNLESVGNIKMCAIREHRFPFLKKVEDWNRFNSNTGGTLVEKCCHFFDLMNQIIPSDPVSVFASGGQDVNHLDEIYDGKKPDILDNAYVIVNYANGARALLDLCMFAEGSKHEQEIAITGDTGKIEVTIPGRELIISERSSNDFKRIPVDPDLRIKEQGFHHGASYLEHLSFLEAINNKTEPEVSIEDGFMSVVLGLAAQQSIATGQLIKISDVLKG
ncbi:Gfo/Idh/MocA family oxidoreductase [Gammaproteobacteria bacterium]|nr:Gfo/Idh/MocA family oxidoreductase [Gammaproteobacteria bacterium]